MSNGRMTKVSFGLNNAWGHQSVWGMQCPLWQVCRIICAFVKTKGPGRSVLSHGQVLCNSSCWLSTICHSFISFYPCCLALYRYFCFPSGGAGLDSSSNKPNHPIEKSAALSTDKKTTVKGLKMLIPSTELIMSRNTVFVPSLDLTITSAFWIQWLGYQRHRVILCWINLSDLSKLRRHVVPALAVNFLTTPSVQLMQSQSLPQGRLHWFVLSLRILQT